MWLTTLVLRAVVRQHASNAWPGGVRCDEKAGDLSKLSRKCEVEFNGSVTT